MRFRRTLILALAMLASRPGWSAASVSLPCLKAAEAILGAEAYDQSLRRLEATARPSKFEPLARLDELRETHPRKFKNLSKRLGRAANDGLTPAQVEKLVADLYAVTHPEWKIHAFARAGYAGLKRSYIVDAISKRLLKENFVEVFKEAGWLRDPGAIERFRTRFQLQIRAVSWLLSIAATVGSLRGGIPFWTVPDFALLERIVLPPELVEKIMNEGIDSAYADLEKLCGGRGDFTAIWSEFRRYANYAAYVSMGYVVYQRAKTGYLRAGEKDLEAARVPGQDETTEERDLRVQKELAEWQEKYRSDKGHDPSSQEIEDMARILKFYGKSGRQN